MTSNSQLTANFSSNNNNLDDLAQNEIIGQIVEILQAVPGRLSLNEIRRLAKRYKFEVFEEAVNGGHRLSLGGSIIVLDIDLSLSPIKVSQVSLSLASNLDPKLQQYSFSSKSIVPSAEELILKSLSLPKLDKFADILLFLSQADRLSSSTVDNFRILDHLAYSLFNIYSATAASWNSSGSSDKLKIFQYGRPVLNPDDRLGLGIMYWQEYANVSKGEQSKAIELDFTSYCAFWTIRPINDGKSAYAVRAAAEWTPQPVILNPNGLVQEWKEPEDLVDAKAEFILKLDPHVYLSEPVAYELNCTYETTEDYFLNSMSFTSKRTVHISEPPSQFTTSFSNLLPYKLVKVSEIPISHPKFLPEILNQLRQHILIETIGRSFKTSNLKTDIEAEQYDNEDLLLADAILDSESSPPIITGPNSLQADICLIDKDHRLCFVVGLTGSRSLRAHVTTEVKSNGSVEVLVTGDSDDKVVLNGFNKALSQTEDLAIACCFVQKLESDQ